MTTFLAAALAANTQACTWDRDTLAAEAKGRMDYVETLVGRFERNPPLYYQMRLDRETLELAKNPALLDHFDDLGVAEMRLGHCDRALYWMARKRAELGSLSNQDKDSSYRLLSNEGTFYLLRWMSKTTDLKNTHDLSLALTDIDQAIKINPEAHFGREWVQRDFISWLLKRDSGTFSDAITANFEMRTPEQYARGLTGLIQIGSGWESPDITAALGRALAEFQKPYAGQVAALAFYRTAELIKSGKKVFGDERTLDRPYTFYNIDDDEPKTGHGASTDLDYFNRPQFLSLRAQAEEWNARRTAFMLARLRVGRHPDSDPHFWDGYIDGPPLTIRTPYPWDDPNFKYFAAGGLVCGGIPLGLIVWIGIASWKNRRRRIAKRDAWIANQ